MNCETATSPYIAQQTSFMDAGEIASSFRPDIVLPTQYFDHCRKETLLEAEKRLMLAVLEDGLNCFQENRGARCGKKKKLFEEARQWIFEGRSDWLFGFDNVCGVLDLDPAYMRRILIRWKEKELSKQRHAPA